MDIGTMVLSRRQALLAILATPMAQVPDKGEPGTLTIDLHRWKEVVFIGPKLQKVILSADEIFSALQPPPSQAFGPSPLASPPQTTDPQSPQHTRRWDGTAWVKDAPLADI